MKVLGIVVLVLMIFCAPACVKTPVPHNQPEKQTPIIKKIDKKQIEPAAKKAFSTAFISKKSADGSRQPRPIDEILLMVKEHLEPASYLTLARHILLDSHHYSINQKIDLFTQLSLLSDQQYTKDVLSFFVQVLSENKTYLERHPIIDLDRSLVSSAPDSSTFIHEYPAISDSIWSIEELYRQGNNLLQEAVRLNNVSAVNYLLRNGATPRYLSDVRGPLIALEWADKYGYTDVIQELTKDINMIGEGKTTLLDNLLYKDPDAAQLLAKYGGKTAVELG